MFARQVLASMLVTALVVAPAAAESSSAGNRAPLGSVSFSHAAQILGVPALESTTVFAGDLIQVGARGRAWVMLQNGMQLHISEKSQVQLAKPAAGDGAEFTVLAGQARFRTSAAQPLIGRLADATIRAESTEAVGIVAILNQRSAIIGAERGTLLITTAHNSRTVALKEGTMVDVTLAPDPQAVTPPQSAGTSNLTNWQLGMIAVLGVAAALGIGLALSLREGGLTDQQKRNLVSPFRFP